MNIIHYSIQSFLTNEYYLIIRFASKRLFVATLIQTSCLQLPLRHIHISKTFTTDGLVSKEKLGGGSLLQV